MMAKPEIIYHYAMLYIIKAATGILMHIQYRSLIEMRNEMKLYTIMAHINQQKPNGNAGLLVPITRRIMLITFSTLLKRNRGVMK